MEALPSSSKGQPVAIFWEDKKAVFSGENPGFGPLGTNRESKGSSAEADDEAPNQTIRVARASFTRGATPLKKLDKHARRSRNGFLTRVARRRDPERIALREDDGSDSCDKATASEDWTGKLPEH